MFRICSWRRFASTGGKGRLVDRVRIYARGGGGGQGFPRLGGAGADGSNVLVKAKRGSSLGDIARRETRRFIGITGANRTRRKTRKGKDVIISVPPGTVIVKDDGQQLYDLNVAGKEYLLARGGAGGDHTNNYLGKRGESCVVSLILKTIADIGMVGFPNAGKSTLLRALSWATPKVADYPFTTLRPHLGIVEYNRSGDQLSVADLPGLVEGAHNNVGMGHKFLRHIERTKVLLFVVDVHGFQLSRKHPYRDAVETVNLLLEELENYQEGLSTRPAVLVVNKMDLPGAKEKLSSMLPAVEQMNKFNVILPAAAQLDEGIEPVVDALVNALQT